MTRRLRIVHEPDTTKPWVVQYDAARDHLWTDGQRFKTRDEAALYLAEINERDRALLEAER